MSNVSFVTVTVTSTSVTTYCPLTATSSAAYVNTTSEEATSVVASSSSASNYTAHNISSNGTISANNGAMLSGKNALIGSLAGAVAFAILL